MVVSAKAILVVAVVIAFSSAVVSWPAVFANCCFCVTLDKIVLNFVVASRSREVIEALVLASRASILVTSSFFFSDFIVTSFWNDFATFYTFERIHEQFWQQNIL